MAARTIFVPAELDVLIYWIVERERIRAMKEAGAPKPWTSDALLRDYRWCNVRRMDDAVSRAMLRDWYRHDADPATALTAACLGRLVNWPDSLMGITGGMAFELAQLDGAAQALRARQRAGQKVFTGAYVVPGLAGESKIDTVVGHARWAAEKAREIYQPTLRATWASLCRLDGLGSFLCGQMVADIAELDAGRSWPDRLTWAPLGPGSARGMNRLLGRPKTSAMTQDEFDVLLQALMGVLTARVPELWSELELRTADAQGLCCEFDKYRRLQLDEGKVRARYDGGNTQVALL